MKETILTGLLVTLVSARLAFAQEPFIPQLDIVTCSELEEVRCTFGTECTAEPCVRDSADEVAWGTDPESCGGVQIGYGMELCKLQFRNLRTQSFVSVNRHVCTVECMPR